MITSRQTICTSISVPVQLAIDAQQNRYRKKLRLFLLLKLMFPSGKSTLSNKDLKFLELAEMIRTRDTTLSYINFLIAKEWLVRNKKPG